MEKLPIFVYGTLKIGGQFDAFRNKDRTVTNCMLQNAAIYNLGAFPGLKLERDSYVVGELHQYPDEKTFQEVIESLDWIEGFHGSKDDLFKRELVHVTLSTGEKVQAHTYIYNHQVKEKWKIQSGKWKTGILAPAIQ